MEGPDDALEFHIFLDPTAQETPAEVRLRCHAALIAICGRFAPRLEGCVWHRDPFELWLWDPERDAAQAPLMAAGKAEMHLWGRMSFGESSDDEWFAVGLLLQLSAEQARSVNTYTPTHRLRVPDSRATYSKRRAACPEAYVWRTSLGACRVHCAPWHQQAPWH